MPWNRPTLARLEERIERDISGRLLDGASLPARSVLRTLTRVWAGACHHMHGFFAWAFPQVHPDTAEVEYLERWARIWGVSRKSAAASSGPAKGSGLAGYPVPAGTALLHRTSKAAFTVTSAATLSATGAIEVALTAVTAGAAGNLPEGTALDLVSPLAGVENRFFVGAGGLTGGADAESDASLRARLLSILREPPHGGNQSDYVQWALEVPGVTRAWCYPLYLGLGTVGVTFLTEDSGPSPIPSAEMVARVQAHINEKAPVTAFVEVFAPEVLEIDVKLRITPDTAQVRAAVEAEIRDLWRREAAVGGRIPITHLHEAVSIAAGEEDHVLITPTADVAAPAGVYPLLAGVEFAP